MDEGGTGMSGSVNTPLIARHISVPSQASACQILILHQNFSRRSFFFTRGNSRKPCLHLSGLLLHNAGVKLHGVSCCGDFDVLSLSLRLSSLFPDKKMTGDQCSRTTDR